MFSHLLSESLRLRQRRKDEQIKVWVKTHSVLCVCSFHLQCVDESFCLSLEILYWYGNQILKIVPSDLLFLFYSYRSPRV